MCRGEICHITKISDVKCAARELWEIPTGCYGKFPQVCAAFPPADCNRLQQTAPHSPALCREKVLRTVGQFARSGNSARSCGSSRSAADCVRLQQTASDCAAFPRTLRQTASDCASFPPRSVADCCCYLSPSSFSFCISNFFFSFAFCLNCNAKIWFL